MSTEELMTYAESRGHRIFYTELRNIKAITLDDGNSYIALSKSLHGIEEKEIAAHELGHCEYGGTYNRYSPFSISAKAERRAKKWAFYRLVPPRDIRAAFTEGVVECWDLAERFDVSCAFMREALEYYKSVGII